MGNRYKEVLTTYLRRPFSSWQMGSVPLWGVFWIGMSCLPGHLELFLWLLGELFIAGSLWGQFREQMAVWQRMIAPKYTPPQILAFALLGLAVVLAIPLPATLVQNRPYLAALSVSILLFGSIGVFIALPSVVWLTACAVALFLFSLNQFGIQGVVIAALSGDHHNLTWWLLAFGTVLTVTAVIRLAYLTEDRIGFAAPLGGWLAPSHYGLAWLPHHAAAMRGRVRWRRTRVFRLGKLLSTLPFVLIPIWIIGLTQHPSQLNVIVSSRYVLPFLALFPAMAVGGRCIANFQFLATESLRPATRSAFIKGLATSLFLNGFRACVVTSLVFLAAVYVAGGGLAGALLLVPFIISIILAQPLILALAWWVAQYRSVNAEIIALVALMEIPELFFPDANYWGILAGGAVCMLLGLILIPFVYRSWLNVEMG